ncbi:MAG: hypothetical protein H6599_11465 [Flavobacteriales bacterium]|nr:hypothetical protein [Flavobacteriales bacterium]
MKKILFLVLFATNISALACDNCNVYVGINPNDFYHNIGIRLRSRFHSGTYDNSGLLMLKHGGVEPIYANSTIKETYQRLELAGKYYWNPKWNTEMVVPYVMNTQEINQSLEYFVQGLGDIMLLQNYLVFNTKDHSDTITFRHRLSIGIGLKIPTGRINIERPKGIPNIDLQPGTGSWDGVLSLTYSAMVKKSGVLVNGNYKMNTFNKNDFKYGNTTNLTTSLFYLFQFGKKVQLMPSLGVYAEYFSHDYFNNELSENSGGNTWMIDAGISNYFNNFKLQVNYQYALSNSLKDEQLIPTKWRYNVGAYYNF